MLPLYLAKQSLMLVSMQIFLDHEANKLVCIPMAKIFIYLFTAMLHDVTITSLLCLCIICYKTDVYPPADSFVNGSTSVETLRFQLECPACIRQTWSSLILAQRSIVRTIFDSSWPGNGSVAWYPSKMPPTQMDISTGWCASEHST